MNGEDSTLKLKRRTEAARSAYFQGFAAGIRFVARAIATANVGLPAFVEELLRQADAFEFGLAVTPTSELTAPDEADYK